jgi:two-component system sensor histidine kinase KdpD
MGGLLGKTRNRVGLRRWAGYPAAAVGVAGMTGMMYLVPGAARIANASMLYLLVVMGVAVGFGSRPAIFASLLAFLAFDWFFVNPRHTLTVADPAEWIALLAFLATAVVTGQLTALLRASADEARRREREAAALAETSMAVASHVDRDRALAEVLRRLAEVVPLESGGVMLPEEGCAPAPAAWFGRPPAPGAVVADACRFVMQEARPIGWEDDSRHWEQALAAGRAGVAYLPLLLEHRVAGVLYLRLRAGYAPSPQERRAVASLASQAAVALERDRLARAETAARALEEADRLKTALLSMVSHDFRSPLTSIKASVTTLLQKDPSRDPATGTELLEGIDRETDRLNRMVGNILALSRLEADAWRPHREPTSVPELVGAALDSFDPESSRRIQVVVAPGAGEAALDPVQLVQVLRNILDNALKYSAAEAPVELRAGREGDTLVIEVLDRGFGLPEGQEERVFEPFFRAPHLRESSLPGVGIGLAVCRGLVEAHGGRLTARRREGGGSAFRIELPSGLPADEGPGY